MLALLLAKFELRQGKDGIEGTCVLTPYRYRANVRNALYVRRVPIVLPTIR